VISPVDAFSRAAGALYRTLRGLDDADWRRPALRDLDVQGLTGHLIGVEEDIQRGLAGDPAVAGADHVESTQDSAVRQASRSPALTMRDWRRAADRTLAEARSAGAGTGTGTGADGGRVAVHGLRLPLDDLLVVRAFELWVHENDIRRCAGLVPSVPDPPVLRLMSDLAVRMLPYAAARTGLRERVDVHLVLTGPGGGTWDVTVGQQPDDLGPGDQGPGQAKGYVAIVTDAVGFCRLAANRTTPAELGPYVTGDAGCAAEVLAATSTLGLD